jgi:glycosyltransferase involved in cell wall biosynthesis
MKILILGWEYPPNINGGLGTACEGLTTSLAKLGVKIDFVLPRLSGRERAPHMTLIDSITGRIAKQKELLAEKPEINPKNPLDGHPELISPYARPEHCIDWMSLYRSQEDAQDIPPEILALLKESNDPVASSSLYGSNIFVEVTRFMRNVAILAQGRKFDVIHAHDWMTYPAGLAVAKFSGKPLIVHVHSLEYDRTGISPDPDIHAIERSGVREANIAIAVSNYTKKIVHSQHNVPLKKIAVVHNGVYAKEVIQNYKGDRPRKTVLFLGRITFQKGPEYFVEAAARVITLMPEVQFVMAGSGDMLPTIKRRVKDKGLSNNFVFPGFLKGHEVERMYSMADLYIMPSVSEPFGIAPLEAMSHDVPVIISKQSGVAELLSAALKVDFWDVEKLAHLIVGVLKYPEVRADIVGLAREEVRRIHWDAAAKKTFEIYKRFAKARR